MNPVLEHAQWWARQGIFVNAIQPNTKELVKSGPVLESATRDPDEINGLFATHPTRNLGVVSGPESNLLVLDPDVKKGNKGLLALERMQKICGAALPRTVDENTPTGGKHLHFRLDGATVPNGKLKIDGIEGLEVFGRPHNIVVAPSQIDGKTYKLVGGRREIVPLPPLFIEFILSHYIKGDKTGQAKTEGRNNGMFAEACRLRSDDVPEAEAWDKLLALNSVLCKPPLAEGELKKLFRSAWKYDAGHDGALVAEMNAAHAVINWKGRTLVLREGTDPTTERPMIELSTMTDMRAWLANKPKIGKVPYFDAWLAHPQRRQYQGVVFEPGREINTHFNLWRGWGVEPKAGDCSLWLTMLNEVICSHNETHYRYVLEWCADAIQNPTERPGIVLVLRGPQGTGKGTFARVLGKLFGDHFLHIRHARHLTGNFNAHLSNVLLLFADEAYFPGDKTGEGALKALITEPTIPLEYKGKDVISVNNYIRVVMASNNDWVVPAAMDDRRFAIFDVSREHAQDTNYFGAIFRQLDVGGYEALLQFLLGYPLGDVDLRKIPDTEARREQQVMSLDPFFAFWLQWLQDPVRDATDSNFYVTSDLYDQYRRASPHPISRVSFAMRLCKLFPNATRDRQTSADPSNFEGRVWGYRMPTLAEMRSDYDRRAGRPTDWPSVPTVLLGPPSDEPPEREP